MLDRRHATMGRQPDLRQPSGWDGIVSIGTFALFNLVSFVALVVDRPKRVPTAIEGA